MRWAFSLAPALLSATLLTACGAAAEPHTYPADAKAEFNTACPADDAVCVCTWDAITRAMPHEDYAAAMETFRSEGRMDPRLTRIRTKCLNDAK